MCASGRLLIFCAALVACSCFISGATCASIPQEEDYMVEDSTEEVSTEQVRSQEEEEEPEETSFNEAEMSHEVGKPLSRKLWDCVEDKKSLTCFKDIFYDEFSAKVLHNPQFELIKRYIDQHILLKRLDYHATPGGYDALGYRLPNLGGLPLQLPTVGGLPVQLPQILATQAPAQTTAAPATTTAMQVVTDDMDTDDGDDRGMKKKMMDFLPYLMTPALLMAGVMPWVIPPLKMMVMFVSMINNMAFSSALFSLVRNYVFNRRQDEHVFYVNHGYQNHEKLHNDQKLHHPHHHHHQNQLHRHR